MNSSTKILRDIAGTNQKVTRTALLLMLVGILLPAASYSMRLTNPTPSDLLVAISVGLFSSVLFLWILDATSLLTFRAVWMSKAIYGAAIVSVLGTSVGVYKDYFQSSKYPYDGVWHLSLKRSAEAEPIECSLLVAYSKNAEKYWGYSNLVIVAGGEDKPKITYWFELIDYVPNERNARFRVVGSDGSDKTIEQSLNSERKTKLLTPSGSLKVYPYVELRRPE
jgi:hypothetical protein